MKELVILLLVFNVVHFSRADRIGDAFKYMDEVLTVHVPWAIEEAGLEVSAMPEFINNVQYRSQDGLATNAKVHYYSGSVTGLQEVYRKACREPTWNSANLSVYCHIVFPEITINYAGMVQLVSSHSNNVRLRQNIVKVVGKIIDMEAAVEVIVSPYVRVPQLKSLSIVDGGRYDLRFSDSEYIPVEILRPHFYHKFNDEFLDVFYQKYKPAIERGIQSIQYPF